jgi:hypothetical protein
LRRVIGRPADCSGDHGNPGDNPGTANGDRDADANCHAGVLDRRQYSDGGGRAHLPPCANQLTLDAQGGMPVAALPIPWVVARIRSGHRVDHRCRLSHRRIAEVTFRNH